MCLSLWVIPEVSGMSMNQILGIKQHCCMQLTSGNDLLNQAFESHILVMQNELSTNCSEEGPDEQRDGLIGSDQLCHMAF